MSEQAGLGEEYEDRAEYGRRRVAELQQVLADAVARARAGSGDGDDSHHRKEQ